MHWHKQANTTITIPTTTSVIAAEGRCKSIRLYLLPDDWSRETGFSLPGGKVVEEVVEPIVARGVTTVEAVVDRAAAVLKTVEEGAPVVCGTGIRGALDKLLAGTVGATVGSVFFWGP